ncbi:MAG: SDR family NAD(P)-dependent oxidoreductase [bacterium]|nr:SDR family NAD(P)-dependent oxidoreductase [bacterium]
MDLSGARALVTGGSEGIGKGIATALIAKGAQVAIMARDEQKLAVAAAEIGALAIAGDVADADDAERAVATVEKEFGGLDILVNNAGIGYFAPLIELDQAAFERVFAVNVTGAMLMGRAAARRFVTQNKGCIVNVSSTSGLAGGKTSSAYSGSKFALRGMTECWRAELRPHNVRVMLVNPSEVQTPFFGKVGHEQELKDWKLRPREIADAVVGALEIDDRGFIPEFSVFATNPFQ